MALRGNREVRHAFCQVWRTSFLVLIVDVFVSRNVQGNGVDMPLPHIMQNNIAVQIVVGVHEA